MVFMIDFFERTVRKKARQTFVTLILTLLRSWSNTWTDNISRYVYREYENCRKTVWMAE